MRAAPLPAKWGMAIIKIPKEAKPEAIPIAKGRFLSLLAKGIKRANAIWLISLPE